MDPENEDGREEEINEENEEGSEAENGGENEEEEVDFWGDFQNHMKAATLEEQRKKKSLSLKIKTYKKRTQNPLRAELFTRMKSFVKGDARQLQRVIDWVEYEDGEELLAQKKMSSRADNITYKIIRVVKYVMENLEDDSIYYLICDLNMRDALARSEAIEWSAFELKKSMSDPDIEFMKKVDDTVSQEELKTMIRAIRKKLNTTLKDEATTKEVFVRTTTKDKFLFIAVMEVITSRGKSGRQGRLQCPCLIVAFNPKVPLVCVHAKSIRESFLLKIVNSFPGGYGAIRSVGLKDVGLSRVYDNFLRINCAALATSQEFKSRIEEEERLDAESGVQDLAPFQNDRKRRRILKNLLDDKQEGFKNFTLEFQPSKTPDLPITFKFTAQKGNLNGLVADMFERRVWNNPLPYLMARERKQNSIKVKIQDQKHGFAIVEPDEDSNSVQDE